MSIYFNPVKIVKTDNWFNELNRYLRNLQIKNPIIITTNGNRERLLLNKKFSQNLIFSDFGENPNFNDCNNSIEFCKGLSIDGVITIGGGSAMDLAKVVLAYLRSGEKKIKKLINPGLEYPIDIPSIFLPTTHGTASEVTMWGTIWNMEEKKKYSISHPNLYPKIAILDGALTLTLPLKISIITILDALSHSFEAIWNKNSNEKSTRYAIEAICSILSSIDKFKKNQTNIKIRNQLLQASTTAGLAFSNTKTAAAHSMSYPLTINYNIPHGIASSLTLLPLLEKNGPFIDKELRIICKNLKLSINELNTVISDIPKNIIPFNLKDWGVKKSHIQILVNESFTKGRMDNNITELSNDDVFNILNTVY